jgi:hypothetical protein
MDLEITAYIVDTCLKILSITAGIVAIWQFKLNTDEKRKENRHKQAYTAKEMIESLFLNEKSRDALKMLDWSGRTYKDGKENYVIEVNDIKESLRTDNLNFDDKKNSLETVLKSYLTE